MFRRFNTSEKLFQCETVYTEWSDIFVGWFFLGFIPGLLVVLKSIKLTGIKKLILDVALPFVDVVTDFKFVYDTYQANLLLRLYDRIYLIEKNEIFSLASWNETWLCFDHTANKSFTPSIEMGKPFFSLSMNVTCIESSSGLEYKPLSEQNIMNAGVYCFFTQEIMLNSKL